MLDRVLRLGGWQLLGAVFLAQISDLMTFIPAVGRTGIQAEANPIARDLFLLVGAPGPAFLKLFAVVALVLLVRRVAIRFPSYALPTAVVAIAVGLLGTLSNVLSGLAA
jgi:hypothetical protein